MLLAPDVADKYPPHSFCPPSNDQQPPSRWYFVSVRRSRRTRGFTAAH